MMTRITLAFLVAGCVLAGCKGETPAPAPDVEPEPTTAEQVIDEKPEDTTFGHRWANADAAARKAAFASGDKLSDAREILVYQVLRNAASDKNAEPLGPYHLMLANQKTRDYTKGARVGLRRIRGVVVQQARLVVDDELKNTCDIDCQRMAMSNGFTKFAGAPLFVDGALQAAPLRKLLSAFYIAPDATLLGIEAHEVYALLKPTVHDITGLYVGLTRVGRDEVLKAFAGAQAEHADPEKGVNRALLLFYRSFTNSEDIASKVGLMPHSSHWTVVSFWIRRMADGTDSVFREFMIKGLKDYDPTWHDVLFSSPSK